MHYKHLHIVLGTYSRNGRCCKVSVGILVLLSSSLGAIIEARSTGSIYSSVESHRDSGNTEMLFVRTTYKIVLCRSDFMVFTFAFVRLSTFL